MVVDQQNVADVAFLCDQMVSLSCVVHDLSLVDLPYDDQGDLPYDDLGDLPYDDQALSRDDLMVLSLDDQGDLSWEEDH